MKDYHDALLIIRSGDLPNGPGLKSAIDLTFANRSTALAIPLSFNDEQIKTLQAYWSAHLKKLGVRAEGLKLPANIADIITELNTWANGALK